MPATNVKHKDTKVRVHRHELAEKLADYFTNHYRTAIDVDMANAIILALQHIKTRCLQEDEVISLLGWGRLGNHFVKRHKGHVFGSKKKTVIGSKFDPTFYPSSSLKNKINDYRLPLLKKHEKNKRGIQK